MKRILWIVPLAAVATAAALQVSAAQGTNATLVVTLPPDAKLYFDDHLTQQTGGTRTFTTPPLNPGSDYTYTLKAEAVRQGQVRSQTQQVAVRAGQTSRVTFTGLDAAATLPNLPTEDADAAREADGGWPKKVSKDGNTLSVYQPQVESWEGNKLTARAAVAVETRASPQPTYGVVWLGARTDVDREKRLVALDDIQILKANFPAHPEKADDYLALVKSLLPTGTRTVALDRLLANLAITQAEAGVKKVPLKNDPPRVFFSTKPAVLVLVDGKPALRQVSGSKLLRVINTRALILLDQASGIYYLHLMDHWVQAVNVEGPWQTATAPPPTLESAKKSLADAGQVDLLDDPAPDLKAAMEAGTMPVVFVSTTPAELLDTEGEPDVAPIEGTKLLWVKNTSDEILMDLNTQDYYALLSGRWYRAKSLSKGPWEFVPADKLPADFAKIPETHPKGDVLASVAGTPYAKEALIANRIPQTAVVKRSEAKFAPVYDGDPDFQPVEDTKLRYAANSPTPVIEVSPKVYYAVENGVWFTASSPAGPWVAATEVPPDIYAIPPSSPIYYATNVYVYGATPEEVYVGYTPGYYGACVAPWGGVVYGTGWYYRPWIGRVWYGRPWTYGYGAGFRWSPVGGWGLGFGAAVGRPWWGPVGWNAGWSRGAWRAGWERGWGGRYAGVHASGVHVSNVNLYNRWGGGAVQTRAVSRTAVRTGTVTAGRGLNNVYAGPNGNVYRRSTGGWQTQTRAGNWSGVKAGGATANTLNRQFTARQAGAVQTQTFRATGGHGGVSGYRGGFRSGGYSGARGFSGGGRRR